MKIQTITRALLGFALPLASLFQPPPAVTVMIMTMTTVTTITTAITTTMTIMTTKTVMVKATAVRQNPTLHPDP